MVRLPVSGCRPMVFSPASGELGTGSGPPIHRPMGGGGDDWVSWAAHIKSCPRGTRCRRLPSFPQDGSVCRRPHPPLSDRQPGLAQLPATAARPPAGRAPPPVPGRPAAAGSHARRLGRGAAETGLARPMAFGIGGGWNAVREGPP